MTAYTLRWLIFTALCALLLLSLPAKYGRAESNAPDRTESRSLVVQGNDRDVHRLVLCTRHGEVRVFHANADVDGTRHENEGNRPVETSCVFPGTGGDSLRPRQAAMKARAL